MGFADYGSSILRNNKRLLNQNKKKHFQGKRTWLINGGGKVARLINPQKRLEAEQARRRKLVLTYGLYVVIFAVALVLMVRVF